MCIITCIYIMYNAYLRLVRITELWVQSGNCIHFFVKLIYVDIAENASKCCSITYVYLP